MTRIIASFVMVVGIILLAIEAGVTIEEVMITICSMVVIMGIGLLLILFVNEGGEPPKPPFNSFR